jgi:hypothetical protein
MHVRALSACAWLFMQQQSRLLAMPVLTLFVLHEPSQRTLLVTDQRVLFLWRKYNTTLCTYSREESFSLDDLKVSVLLLPAHTCMHQHACGTLRILHATF